MGVYNKEKLKLPSPFLCCPVIHECQVKENPDRKLLGLDKRLDISFSIVFGIYFIAFFHDQTLHLLT